MHWNGKVLIDNINRMDHGDPTAALEGASASEQIQSTSPSVRQDPCFSPGSWSFSVSSHTVDPSSVSTLNWYSKTSEPP